MLDFLFNTQSGLACLMGGGIVLSTVIAILLERRTQKKYPDQSRNQNPEEND